MRKLLSTFAILTALLFAVSCQSDWYNGGGDGDRPGDREGFRLRFDVAGSNLNAGSSLNTRVSIPSEEGEDNVNTLHVLFFNAENGNFVDWVNVPTDGDGNSFQVRFRDQPLLNSHTDYNLLLVANIEPFLDGSLNAWLDSFVGTNLTTAQASVLSLNHFDVNTQIQRENLLMTAVARKYAIDEVVDVTLTRAVVRVDVNLRAGLDFELVSAEIWNVPNNTSVWDANNNDYSDIAIIQNRAIQRFEVPAAYARGFQGRLYTFENRQNTLYQNDRRTTAVILGLRPSAGGATQYFRANIAPPFAALDMRRNTVHSVTVNHVLAAGADNPTAAYNEENFLLETTVNNIDMDNRGVILIDGDNVLVLPTNRIAFSPEGGTRDFTIFTYSPDPALRLGISQLVMSDGLSAHLCVETNRLSVTALSGEHARYGFIEFRFGNIIARIEVVQEATFVEYLELNWQMGGIDGEGNTLPGGIPQFPNYFPIEIPAGNPMPMDGFVQVTSSGEWTATMFNHENFEFSFESLTGSNLITPGINRFIEGNTGGQFRLDAVDGNTDNFIRFGFVVVSLVSNPNINRVLIVTQRGREAIQLFHPGNLNNELLVYPRTYLDAMGGWSQFVNTRAVSGQQSSREYVIRHSAHGRAPEDWIRVQPSPGSTMTEAEIALHFPLSFVQDTPTQTRVFIEDGIRNNTGQPITGQIFIGFAGITPQYIFVEQGRFVEPDMTAFTTGTAPVTGETINMTAGKHHLIGGVAAGSELSDVILPWTASIAVAGSVEDVAGRTRTVTNHTVATTAGATNLQVQFPKVFYPNRRIEITATLTVTCELSGARTYTRAQEPLMPRDFNIRSQQDNITTGGDAQGGLHTGGNTGMELLRDHLRSQATNQPITTNMPWGPAWPAGNDIPATYTMVYNTQAGFTSGNRPGRWPILNTWHRDGATATDVGIPAGRLAPGRLLWMNSSIVGNIDGVNVGPGGTSPGTGGTGAPSIINEPQPFRRSPLQLAGFPTVNAGTANEAQRTGQLFTTSAGRRIYDFLVSRPDNDGIAALTAVSLLITAGGGDAGTSWMLVGANGAHLPPNAVPVIRRGPDNERALLVICPVNHLIWMGDGELFRAGNDSETTRRFIHNLVTFANNAARYGEHFMYMFRQDATVPPIWDDAWGNNTNVDFTYPAASQN